MRLPGKLRPDVEGGAGGRPGHPGRVVAPPPGEPGEHGDQHRRRTGGGGDPRRRAAAIGHDPETDGFRRRSALKPPSLCATYVPMPSEPFDAPAPRISDLARADARPADYLDG